MKPYHTPLKVYPVSWDKKINSNLQKDWEIRYIYYCDDYPEGKTIRFKGMNHCRSLPEKQDHTRMLIDKETSALAKGFNPITQEYEFKDENIITEDTPFYRALEVALKSFKGVDSTIKDFENTLKHVSEYSLILGIKHKELATVTKGDIKQMLMKMSQNGKSNYRVNKTRAHLSRFFSHFTELDIFQVNFIEGIKNLEHQSSKRKIIRTSDEWERFHSIADLNYNVYCFLMIFLYSGCRFEEMAQIKRSDVELEKSIFWINLRKGGKHTRAMRAINIQTWKYWKQYCDLAGPDQYLFSHNQAPNDIKVKGNALIDVSAKYLRAVGLDVTGYSLKATFLNLVSKEHGITKAKELAGHTNERTTRIYAVDHEEHLVEQNRMIKVSTK
ncbi:site-specific integrase [uncultured Chryseobacterium sp.]|uniref:tyrosine-type recombinase/integrase n=1 Tax=uncultured Chryseobacterium sp. TaxID=259322 RepID=UPI0025D656B2|nr:site-specific integrase [uncultured Chryseobacterium sp.]